MMTTHQPTTTDLPDLAPIRRKREASVTPKVIEWFRKNVDYSVAIEVKATKGRSIPSSKLQPHQKRALLDASEAIGLGHKIADTGRRLPFDAFVLKNTPAYVVACFTGDGVCYAIPVRRWRGARIDASGALYAMGGYQAIHRIPIES